MLPGMGAMADLYSAQSASFPQLVIPPWIPAKSGESLADYARRMASAVDPGGPCIVGGTSFGGFVAVEMTRYLADCRGCVLISSVRSPRFLPRRIRWLRVASPFFAPWSYRFAVAATPVLSRAITPLVRPAVTRFLRHVAKSDSEFLRWATYATLRWTDAGAQTVPIRHIHGASDLTLPPGGIGADEVVAGAGHLLVMTHASAVNAFIGRAIDQFSKTRD